MAKSGTLKFRVLNALRENGGWMTTDDLCVLLPQEKRKAVSDVLSQAARGGYAELRSGGSNGNVRYNDWRITSCGESYLDPKPERSDYDPALVRQFLFGVMKVC